MDAVGIIILVPSVLVAFGLLHLYHKHFRVYYNSFIHNILAEWLIAFILGFMIVCLVIDFIATHFTLIVIGALIVGGLIFYSKSKKSTENSDPTDRTNKM